MSFSEWTHGNEESGSAAGWRSRRQQQEVIWPDAGAAREEISRLARLPPLVFAGEIRRLKSRLASVAVGDAFALIAGDCAESFSLLSADRIRDQMKIILQMSLVLTHGMGLPVVKIGRMAGQFAKPRTNAYEDSDVGRIPTFRGHLINSEFVDQESRTPDPRRLVQGYNYSASMLNLVRAFATGGFADLSAVHAWNQDFVAESPAGARYESVADDIDRTMRFLRACGLEDSPALHHSEFYTAHEALVLDYESALTRVDSLTDSWYGCSAHLLWIGERTRQLDGAHIEYVRGIENPIGIKISGSCTPEELLNLCQILDPTRDPGRLVVMTRIGAADVRRALPPLMRALKNQGHNPVWMCDPMHGNTRTAADGTKTRHFEDIMSETVDFIAVAREEGVHPGGVHLELTPEDVTECTGGSWATLEKDLSRNYQSLCDPRLNGNQGLDLAFLVAEHFRGESR
ncbi:class II 3-deoxy-7-phosphoheptulonate synthase [Microbacterium sp. NPDC089321]|uniref:class II 3-deoxy-7-phosphoheptulonate synthase n=1 Tax=Microbacterium sp. NPDC089321 TaxID=3155183 RepID=UPI0034179F61